MTNGVVDNVMEHADQLRELAWEAERIGRLPDETVKRLKAAEVMRLMQPMTYGGYEAHPREFAEAVMATAALDPASGWVCGVVGIHPWLLTFADTRVQEEIWGSDDETWIASPFTPSGVARPVDGGYSLDGRWQFSSGTDHCDWVVLGALLGDRNGSPATPTKPLFAILPRSDYDIVDDSWNVVGLKGTGSKDVIVRGSFVPAYRTMPSVMDPTAQLTTESTQTLHRLPWSMMFPLGLTGAVIGMAEGALASHLDYQRDRVSAVGTAIKDDPYVLSAVAEAAADINAARQELLANVDRMWAVADAGGTPSLADRAIGRRTQIRAAWRAVTAVDQIFMRSGGNALRADNPLQRYWRDVHAGLNHVTHVPGTTFHASTLCSMGVEPQGPLRAMI